MLKNITPFQQEILDVIKGHEIQEVVHAFELLKMNIYLEDYDKKQRAVVQEEENEKNF